MRTSEGCRLTASGSRPREGFWLTAGKRTLIERQEALVLKTLANP